MAMNSRPKTRLPVDPFVLGLFGMVLVATILPCQGIWAALAEKLKLAAIVLLFFLHGARLSGESIRNGMLHGRLQAATLLVTFCLFPLLGIAILRIPGITPAFLPGLCFLTLLPSTVQSSIAFTSLARGNVAAAVCAATLSNLVGVFMTPVLVAMLMPSQDQALNPGMEVAGLAESVGAICLQLLLPFALGHLSRPWTSKWVNHHKALLSNLDRSSILLVVYTAFSAAVVQGLWSRTSWQDILLLSLVCLGLLSFVLLATWQLGRWLGLKREDTIVLFFCGSKKSLATGVPIAGAMFQATDVGLIILPLMVYHQIQLIVCSIIASKLHLASKRQEDTMPES
jgi:sodium/bile acid cotransporter 7